MPGSPRGPSNPLGPSTPSVPIKLLKNIVIELYYFKIEIAIEQK